MLSSQETIIVNVDDMNLAYRMEHRESLRSDWPNGLKIFWIIAASLSCLLGTVWMEDRLQLPVEHPHGRDFFRQWISARNHMADRSIYMDMNEAVMLHSGESYKWIISTNGNPPAAVLLALPFASLDFDTAFVVWNVVLLICLCSAVWVIFRERDFGFSPWIFLPVVTFVLISGPLSEHVQMGQLSLLLLALITGAWVTQRRGNDILSGALIGIATAIKLFPGLLFIYFVAQRNWKAFMGGTLAFVGLYGICWALFGVDSFRVYASEIVPSMGQFYDGWMNASLKGFLTKLFDERSGHVHPLWQNSDLSAILHWFISGIVVVVLFRQAWKATRNETRDLVFSIYVVAMLLLSPVTWDHYYLLLILPIGICWRFAHLLPAGRIFLIAAIVVLALIRPKWVWFWTIPGDGELAFGPDRQRSIADPLHTLTVLSYSFYTLLALFVFSLLLSSRLSNMALLPRKGRC